MDFFEWRVQRGEQADEDAERLAAILVDAAVEVHRHLGPF